MSEVEQASAPKKVASSCWALTCVGVLVFVIAAVATPKLVATRSLGNEAAAIGALKLIGNSQKLHREKGNPSYLDLEGLQGADLVDSVLGAGTKQGYAFTCQASTAHPSSAWAATAAPVVPGKTGERYFATNHTGDLYQSQSPIVVDPVTCEVPAGTERVGY